MTTPRIDLPDLADRPRHASTSRALFDEVDLLDFEITPLDLGTDGQPPSREQLQAYLDQVVHDCPDCQAARARGEAPAMTWPEDPPRPPSNSHARRRADEQMRRMRRALRR